MCIIASEASRSADSALTTRTLGFHSVSGAPRTKRATLLEARRTPAARLNAFPSPLSQDAAHTSARAKPVLFYRKTQLPRHQQATPLR
ncbi:hypothetical protein CYMTET_17672 [Cymbomonas tetramitiformis]|uniref:Uncharacterized protein n=1 Tax=Cymbomonas tetramitiformis TaxID=36881 RepID=A0AAE0G9M2_9CHLO|nr:hypothetical protein CYMTET_17672 [Cymbomonas tetramitiformis]